MFLEWENNSGNYKSSAGNFKTARNLKITLLKTSSKFHWAMWLDFEPFNADKKVSSPYQFLPYMKEEDIFDSFPGIRNIIASDVVRAVSCVQSRDIVHRNIKLANALVSNFDYKSYEHKELERAFGKRPTVCKLGDLGEVRSMYAQTNALTTINRRAAALRGSIHGPRTDNWRTISSISRNWRARNRWRIGSFNDILYNIKSRSVISISKWILKKIPKKVTSKMEEAFKQDLQTQAYPSFSVKCLPVQVTLSTKKRSA